MMKKFLLATVGSIALLGMAAPALAADMAVKAPPPAPLPVIYNWSGFYIGGNGGWGQSRNCVDFFDVTGFDFADGCRESVRRRGRWPVRLPLASQSVGFWRGSSG